MDTVSYAITISRELGSGGAYVGQRLAERLGFLYMDREILCQAAKELQVLEEELECHEERKATFWGSFLQACSACSVEGYTPPRISLISDHTLYRTEAAIIERVAKTNSTVVIGRGGSYILQSHPRHLSIFLHAGVDFRIQRIRELYNVSLQEAQKMLLESDSERKRYFQAISRRNWTDLCQYHLTVNTEILGLEKTENLILDFVQARFGITAVR